MSPCMAWKRYDRLTRGSGGGGRERGGGRGGEGEGAVKVEVYREGDSYTCGYINVYI